MQQETTPEHFCKMVFKIKRLNSGELKLKPLLKMEHAWKYCF